MRAVGSVLFLGLFACGGSTASSRLVLRVDQMLDRQRASAVRLPSDVLDDTSYRAIAPEERYEIVIDDSTVTIRPLGGRAPTGGGAFTGRRRDANQPATYELTGGTMAGGRFVISNGRAELTIYGSGVPIVESERGTLVPR